MLVKFVPSCACMGVRARVCVCVKQIYSNRLAYASSSGQAARKQTMLVVVVMTISNGGEWNARLCDHVEAVAVSESVSTQSDRLGKRSLGSFT